MSEESVKSKNCPICGNPAVVAYRPFCSRRCADIDLGRWFSGGYVVPGRNEDHEPGDDSNEQAPDSREKS